MSKPQTESSVQNAFDLKHALVDLIPTTRPTPAGFLSIADLERMRVGTRATSASKHGLETICGATCEVGAQ